MPGTLSEILVIDDDHDQMAACVRALLQAGHRVREAASGAQGLQLAQQQPPDLILLDIHLGDVSGLELCRRLKDDARTSACFVVYCSSQQADDDDVARALETGADGYVARPVGPRELRARVHAFLRHKHTMDNLRASERFFREQALQQLKAGFAGEIDSLVHAVQVGGSNLTAGALGVGRLSDKSAGEFAQLLRDYDGIVERALHEQTYRSDNRVSPALRLLAERMFRLHAGARDVTELHLRALQRRAGQLAPEQARAVQEAGRMVVLELMGHVLMSYRNHYFSTRVPRPAASPVPAA